MRAVSFPRVLLHILLTVFLLWAGLPGGGGFWPALCISVVPLMFLSGLSLKKNIFLAGFAAGFLHNCLQLYWIVIVLGKYGELPWFFSIPAYLLLSAYMGLYVGIFLYLSSFIPRKGSYLLFLGSFPALWVGLDWLRSFLFTGFPWLDIGYGLWNVPLLLQISDLVGHFGNTFLILLVNCCVYVIVLQRKALKKAAVAFCVTVVSLLVIAGYGLYRINDVEKTLAQVEHVSVGVVQGNIDQSRKWSSAEQAKTVRTYLSGSALLLEQANPPELVVWPETALPFFPNRNPLFGDLQLFVLENEAELLTGAPWYEVSEKKEKRVSFLNSSFVLKKSGEIGDMYFKSHLVPFGEYVPLKTVLPFLAPLVENVGDFSPGKIEKPLLAGKIKAGSLICFESIFPDISRKWVNNGANMLVNLTNDAWYGRSSAPYQSMAMTVYRAVETRRGLVRSANTGISGFVDPLGNVLASSEIFVFWAENSDIPLMTEKTFYTRGGFLFAPMCFLLGLTIALFRRIRAAS